MHVLEHSTRVKQSMNTLTSMWCQSQAVSATNGHAASSSMPIARKASATQLQSLAGSKAAAAVAQPARPAPTAAAFKKRSEIDRRLDGLVAASGRLKDNSKQNIIKVGGWLVMWTGCLDEGLVCGCWRLIGLRLAGSWLRFCA